MEHCRNEYSFDMKILMVNYEYPPLGGGGGVFSRHLAEELSKNNTITVITSNFGLYKPRELSGGVEIIRVPVIMRADQNKASIVSMLSFFPASLWTGYRLLRERQFDIVHSMFAIPSAPSGLALSKKFHIPHVLSVLGGDIYDPSKNLSPHKNPALHYTVKKMMRKSDKVVALSSDIKRRAIEYYNIFNGMDIIHLGIPKPQVEAKTRGDFKFNKEDILLITVGRLVPRKGLQDLIKVVHDIKDPNIKLIVIGDGPEKTKLGELSRSLNVSNNVFFFGHVSDEEKFSLLDLSDIYVSSSQHEGFGIVFLEAMASGLPVVCYDKGGQTDFLQDNKTGFLVNFGDRELLAIKIRELCQNVTRRKQMSQFNSQYIEAFYIKTCAKKYEILYKTLIERSL